MKVFLWFVLTRLRIQTQQAEEDETQFEGGLNPIIIPSLGVALKPSGLLASGADSLFASIFLSVPIPKVEIHECKPNIKCFSDLNWIRQAYKESSKYFIGLNQTTIHNETLMKHITRCIQNCVDMTNENCNTVRIKGKTSECAYYKEKFITGINVVDAIAADWTGNITIYLPTLWDETDTCEKFYNKPSLAKVYKKAMDTEIEEMWSAANSTYSNLMQAYQLNKKQGNIISRPKRGVFMAMASLGLPLISLAATIFNGVKLRKHIRKLENEFNEFAQQSTTFMEQQVQFNEQIIRIHEGIFKDLDEMNCQLDTVAYHFLQEKPFQKWKHLTRALLSGILNNELSMGILPEVISIAHLHTLTQDGIFEGTIYREQPEALFLQGRLTLVNLKRDEHSWKYHFVLTAPRLKESSVFNKYSISQVGIKINNTCMRLELPKEAYKIGEKFYEVTDDNCYERSTSLKICSRPTSDKSVKEHKEVACLAKTEKCEMQITPCKTKTIFTIAGVLAFSESEVKGIKTVSTVEKFEEIPNNGSLTQFHSWKKYKKLLIDDRLIASIDNPIIHIELEPIEKIPWNQFLRQTEIKLDNLNTSKLSVMLIEQKRTVHNLEQFTKSVQPGDKPQWKWLIIEWAGVVSLGIILIIGVIKGAIKMKDIIGVFLPNTWITGACIALTE